jgi:hypothetical protein
MLCKVLQDMYTWDNRYLVEGTVVDWPDDRKPSPHVLQPLTQQEVMRHWARTSDEEFERLNAGSLDMSEIEKPQTPQPDQPVSLLESDRESVLLNALQKMDHEDNDQWTSNGLPLMDTVCELAGVPDLTRAELNAAAPDFRRQQ